MENEFRKKCVEELHGLGTTIKAVVAIALEQNAECERVGGSWRYHAKAVVMQCATALTKVRQMPNTRTFQIA